MRRGAVSPSIQTEWHTRKATQDRELHQAATNWCSYESRRTRQGELAKEVFPCTGRPELPPRGSLHNWRYLCFDGLEAGCPVNGSERVCTHPRGPIAGRTVKLFVGGWTRADRRDRNARIASRARAMWRPVPLKGARGQSLRP